MPVFDMAKMFRWIEMVAVRHGRKAGNLNYLFCSDADILEANLKYLGHDYYTDIITFDYSNSKRIAGDMFISLDTVRTNAERVGADYDEELRRVIIHGVLHLVGINDKGPGEREIMERSENDALSLYKDA